MNGLIKTIKVFGLVVIVLMGAFYLLPFVGRVSEKSRYQESNSLLQQIKLGLLEDDMKTKTLYLDSPEFSGLGGHDARSSRA